MRSRLICFEVDGWSDATGHFDLWNGSECIHSEYFGKASKVHLWEVSSNTSTVRPRDRVPSLSASVGVRGVNRRRDVETVQRLLVAAGLDPGPVDGISGRLTTRAIRAFQASFLRAPDGRVDVNGRTWRELLSR